MRKHQKYRRNAREEELRHPPLSVMPENERLEMLATLEVKQRDLTARIQRLPVVGGRSPKIDRLEKLLYVELDQINQQIQMFSAKEVLIEG